MASRPRLKLLRSFLSRQCMLPGWEQSARYHGNEELLHSHAAGLRLREKDSFKLRLQIQGNYHFAVRCFRSSSSRWRKLWEKASPSTGLTRPFIEHLPQLGHFCQIHRASSLRMFTGGPIAGRVLLIASVRISSASSAEPGLRRASTSALNSSGSHNPKGEEFTLKKGAFPE